MRPAPIYKRLMLLAAIGMVGAPLPICRCGLAAEPAADQSIRIAKLVERLGSDSYQDREQASRELAKLGSASRHDLEAAAESADPEVRLRRRRLVAAVQNLRSVATEHH